MTTKLTTEQIVSNLRQRLAEANHMCDKSFDFHKTSTVICPKTTLKIQRTVNHLESGGTYRIVGALLITKYGPVTI